MSLSLTQESPEQPSKRGRKATGRLRTKLLQIRLSDTEHELLNNFTIKHSTDANKLLREMLMQLTNEPSPQESVMIKVKGHLMYLTKSDAKKLLIELTSQI